MLISPEELSEPFLIPNHAYLFKTAIGWQAHQVWSEVISYRIGAALGLPVPPCFIAVDEASGESGVLVEFFYGYPGEPSPARLVHGADVMTRILSDKKRGRPHAIRTNLMVSRYFVGADRSLEWWAVALAFDALIGNTDRHPENWGFLVRRDHSGHNEFEMAPLFDNGTSLGYEMPEAKLGNVIGPSRLQYYIGKGRHHCGWDFGSDGPTPHFDLCRRLHEAHESAGTFMKSVIRFEMAQIEEIVNECTRFEIATPFSDLRAEFVTALVGARRSLLQSMLGE